MNGVCDLTSNGAAVEHKNGSMLTSNKSRWRANLLPAAVLTDSYKTTHFLQYPECTKLVAYGEFRSGFNKDETDTRLVFFGLQYVLENYIAKQWTLQDVHQAERLFSYHRAGYQPFPFPKHLFLKFIEKNDGYFPVKLEALPEGTCVHAHVPVYQLTAEGEYATLCTYLETLLTQVWYPTTVATLSRRAKDIIEDAFEKSADGGRSHVLINSRLHDFGFRGCTCVEQSIIGGTAHLLNFDGSDTLSACYYAQMQLNDGHPIGTSIPATEHSVMTAWHTERMAIERMIDEFGDGLFACVLDSYDYNKALTEVIPSLAERKIARGGFIVMRPDSGDPIECVMMALEAADNTFGSSVNSKGYKVIQGAGVIQGDGINVHTLKKVLETVMEHGYSAENVAFGMGAGLLQKVNRDTMSFATKLSHIVYADGRARDIMKNPKTDPGKRSIPGEVAVKLVNGVPTVFPADQVEPAENLLRVVYNSGPVKLPDATFSDIRARVCAEWHALPKTADVYSTAIKNKLEEAANGVSL